MLYERTQRANFMIGIMVTGAAVVAWIMFLGSGTPDVFSNPLLGAVFASLLACAVIFSSMTIRVSSGRIDWWLGFRTFHRVVYLADVVAHAPYRTSLLAGLGIKTADFKSWLVIVDGRTAIALQLRDGRKLMLGTPEPGVIGTFIDRARTA